MKLSLGDQTQTASNVEDASGLARLLLPSLQDMLFVALFAAVIGLGPRLLNQDGDLGRHLTIGNYILDARTIPTRDIFSHTLAGSALTPHEWLAQVIYAAAYRLAGLEGVVILCAGLIAWTFALLYRQCQERSGRVIVSLGITILAAAAASLHWLARPHLFTLLMVVLWVEILEHLREGRTRHWWLMPLAMLAWANLHGAFLIGFAIWGLYLVGELLERGWKGFEGKTGQTLRLMLVGGLAAFLASLANPAGWRLWETSLSFLGSSYLVGHTAEYLPLDFHLKSAWPFLAMITLSLFLFGASSGRRPIAHTLVVAAWTGMALLSARNIPIFALAAAPVLAAAATTCRVKALHGEELSGLDRRLLRVEKGLTGHLWPVLGGGLIAILLLNGARLDFNGQGNRFDPQVFPVQAVDWLETQPDLGPGFNYFPWGGYLLYRAWPENRVFIDGQTDFYGEDLTRQYEQVITLQPGWEQVLSRFRVRWVIMPVESELVKALSTTPGWEELYRDGTAAVLSSTE